MPLQGKQYSDLFRVFSELHKRGGVEDDQARSLTFFVSCWVPQYHPHTIYKIGFKGSLRPW